MKIANLLIWASFFLVFPAITLFADEAGKPFMTTYTSKEIDGHTQFWAITQDDRGIMYIGDGYGVQEFDGSNWRLITNSNRSFGRSLAKAADGRIYVGSSGMLGYLAPDDQGKMEYHSLMDFIKPEDRQFNYVWSVQATPEGIWFQTNERLFRFRQATSGKETEDWEVRVWKPQNLFGYTFWIDQTLFVHQFGTGLMYMMNDSLVLMPGGGQFADDRIQVMLPFPGKAKHYLIGTFTRGLFRWDGSSFAPFKTSSDSFLRNGTLYAGVNTPDSCFALGTMAQGLFIVDREGRTKHHFSMTEGMLSKTVSCLFVDKQKNLWVAMDGGVAVLEYDSPISEYIVPGGTGPSDFYRHRGILYIAANDGIYCLEKATDRFKMVSGVTTNPQSFFFHEINKELFVTTNGGIHHIQEGKAVLVLPNNELSNPLLNLCNLSLGDQLIVGGGTDGVYLLRYEAPHRLHLIGHVEETHEYVRIVTEAEPGTVWIGTMDAGVLRLTFHTGDLLHPAVEKFGEAHGLPPGGVVAFFIGGDVIFLSADGVYQFDPGRKRFSKNPFFEGISLGRNPNEGVIKSDQQGNLWVNLGRESAVYRKMPDGARKLEKDQLARFADEVINIIYPEENGVIWFGTANQVIRFAPGRQRSEQADFPALIRRVALAGDSVVYHGNASPGSQTDHPSERSFPYRRNMLRFDFSASSYLNPTKNEFRTMLEGFDDDWSAWSHDTRRYYTNLPAGTYRFHVQARNIFQHESSGDVYAFTIKPPFYATWWAWCLYILGALGLIAGVVSIRTRQLRERSRELEKIVEQRTAQIQEQKNNVEQLSRIGRDITSSLSIENIIHTIYKNVNTLMDASVFTIGLYKPEDNTLEFPAAVEQNKTLPPFSVDLSDEDRLGAWCFNHRSEVIINDYDKEYPKFVGKHVGAIAGEVPQSVLYLPLWNIEKVIGVISAQSFRRNAYNDYHVNILRNLATYSAIALENADAYRRLSTLLNELKMTQDKLVTQSKLAALGALTAGIAHEIKNPLNFITNFAALNGELALELQETVLREKESHNPKSLAEIEEIIANLKQNALRIQEHGKRADSIVRSMLQHSRGGSGERQPSDINAILEEAVNLTYHGMRAQDTGFNIKIEKSLDRSVGTMEVIPQEISRAFLNIISNGCYEAHRKKLEAGPGFSPVISVTTQKTWNQVKITIRDNGNGIPEAIRDKLFTPFFTTKPAGQGTGLGLSITWDIIVSQHKGRISFETEEGENSFTEFTILLPYHHG